MRRLLIALALIGLVVVVSPAELVRSAPTTTTGLFKVSVVKGEGPPIGCVGVACPSIERDIASFDTQPELADLGGASEIVTGSSTPSTGLSAPGGCGIVTGQLKCWGGNRFGQLGNESTTDSLTSLVTATDNGNPITGVTDISIASDTTCIVASGAVRCVGYKFGSETTDFRGSPAQFSKTWVTLLAGGATKVVATGTETCVVKTDETYWCTANGPTPTWTDSGITGVKDVDTCIAGKVSYCRPFGMMGNTWSRVENADNAEAVFYQANAICFYRIGELWCASQAGGGSLKARLIGVMPKPLAIINKAIGYTSTQMFILTKTGILTALTSMISCESCYTNSSGVISRLSAFSSSTSTQYNDIISINGFTNSLDYIPMTVSSDSRSLRTAVPISVKTESGEILSGANIRWNAPDAPGTISSGSNPNVTDNEGNARASVVSGPVSFTIQGGTVTSGASLQSAIITLLVPTSGSINVVVPDPPKLVERTVKVRMTDGSPIPSAQLTLRNSYLAFAYQFVGTNIATWGAQARDTKGYFPQTMCSWCYVPPPAYISGADGNFTFKTFDSRARSTGYDVDVLYDDGSLSQTVKHTFDSADETVTLPMMARIKTSLVDTNPATSGIEISLGSTGTADISVEALDSSSNAIANQPASVEEVCGGMASGGLWQPGLQLDNICRDVSTNTSSSLVTKSSSCNSTTTASTASDGKLKVTLCPKTSTRFRIRGKGAIPTISFCVVVAGAPCTDAAASAGQSTGSTPASTQPSTSVATPATSSGSATKSLKRGRSASLRALLRPAGGGKVTYRSTGGCRVVGSRLIAPSRSASCRLTLTQISKGKRTTKTVLIRVV